MATTRLGTRTEASRCFHSAAEFFDSKRSVLLPETFNGSSAVDTHRMKAFKKRRGKEKRNSRLNSSNCAELHFLLLAPLTSSVYFFSSCSTASASVSAPRVPSVTAALAVLTATSAAARGTI